MHDRKSQRSKESDERELRRLVLAGRRVGARLESEQSHVATVGSAVDETSESKAEVKAKLSGEVRVNFKSDYLPLEKMATPEMMSVIQGNSTPYNPNKPTALAAAGSPRVSQPPVPLAATLRRADRLVGERQRVRGRARRLRRSICRRRAPSAWTRRRFARWRCCIWRQSSKPRVSSRRSRTWCGSREPAASSRISARRPRWSNRSGSNVRNGRRPTSAWRFFVAVRRRRCGAGAGQSARVRGSAHRSVRGALQARRAGDQSIVGRSAAAGPRPHGGVAAAGQPVAERRGAHGVPRAGRSSAPSRRRSRSSTTAPCGAAFGSRNVAT